MLQGASQLAGGYKSISTNSVSLEGKVDQMLKKVKAIKSDFYNLEADFKTQAHRQLSISLKPRGDKGPTGQLVCLVSAQGHAKDFHENVTSPAPFPTLHTVQARKG